MEYFSISPPYDNDIFPTAGRWYYVQKSRRKIQAGQVPRMRDKRNPYRILVGNPAGKNHVQDLGEDGNDIQIVLKCEGTARTGYIYMGLTCYT